MKYVFVDVDHTLFHSAWRDHMSPTANRDSDGTREIDWTAYSLAASHDEFVEEMRPLLEGLHRHHDLVILTAIHERFRGLLRQRLEDAKVLHRFASILMRQEEDDGVPSAMLKPAMAAAYIKGATGGVIRDHVAFVLDDRPDVCEAFRALGVTCLQPHVVERQRGANWSFCRECTNHDMCRSRGTCDISGADL